MLTSREHLDTIEAEEKKKEEVANAKEKRLKERMKKEGKREEKCEKELNRRQEAEQRKMAENTTKEVKEKKQKQ